MKVIAVAGAKGGVGKTSAAVNLAHLGAAAGMRVLLWDLDPQGAATFCFQSSARSSERYLMAGSTKRGRRQAIQQIDASDLAGLLDLIPADPELWSSAAKRLERRSKLNPLARPLESLKDVYDVVILDCAPGVGQVTEAILEVVDLVVTPVVPSPLSIRTVAQFDQLVAKQRPGLRVIAFLSMSDRRKVLHRQIIDQTKNDPRFSKVAVPDSSSVERMGMEQRPTVLASPRSLAATAYRELWSEISEHLGFSVNHPG